MASNDESVEVHIPKAGQAQALPAAVGMHIGLGIVCASALYTGWQRSIVTYPQWAAMLLVAALLLYATFSPRPRLARRTWVRLALALSGLFVLRLCYEPQLAALPGVSELLPPAFLATFPSIALIGVVIVLVSWLAYKGAGGELGLGVIPFRHSVAAAFGLIAALSFVTYLLLHNAHDVPLSDMLRPIVTAAQGGGLVFVLLGIGGGPSVRKAPHCYLALTLILACLRNLVVSSG